MEEEMYVEEIKRELDKIKEKDIESLRAEVQDIKVDLAKNNMLTEQNTEAMKDMSKTMNSVRETMISLSSTNNELAINLKIQNDKIDKIQSRQDKYEDNFKAMEEKSKFDILNFIRTNFVNIIVGGGIIIYLFAKMY